MPSGQVMTVLGPVDADHLLLAHDVCFRLQLTAYGGYGYDHLLTTLPPRFREAGIPDEAIERMLVDNPRRVLASG